MSVPFLLYRKFEKNGSPRAEFLMDEDRRTMRIRVPIKIIRRFFNEKSDE